MFIIDIFLPFLCASSYALSSFARFSEFCSVGRAAFEMLACTFLAARRGHRALHGCTWSNSHARI